MMLPETVKSCLQELLDIAHRHYAPIYLVGGTVRDVLLGREVRDFDFIVPTSAFDAIIKEAARALRAAQVPLDPEFPTTRLVPRGQEFYLDISGMQGDSLNTDISRRDFTINALAMRVEDALTGTAAVVDLVGGQDDLATGTLRMVTDSTFRDDPLRLLRGFRFSGQLGFSLDDATARTMERDSKLLDRVSRERIRDEMLYILGNDAAGSIVPQLAGFGLLHIACSRGADEAWTGAAWWERFTAFLSTPPVRDALPDAAVGTFDAAPLALWSAALVGFADCPFLESAGHRTKEICQEFRLSTEQARLMDDILPDQQLADALEQTEERASWEALLFWSRGPRAWLWLALSQLAQRKEEWEDAIHAALQSWETCWQRRFAQKPLVIGRNLIQDLGLKPGPVIGELVNRLHWLQFLGRFDSYSEGLALAKELLSASDTHPEAPALPFARHLKRLEQKR